MRPTLSGEKNAAGDTTPEMIRTKPIHRVLIPVHRRQQLLHLWRRRRETRELAGELVDR
jgi:hypothetical protein